MSASANGASLAKIGLEYAGLLVQGKVAEAERYWPELLSEHARAAQGESAKAEHAKLLDAFDAAVRARNIPCVVEAGQQLIALNKPATMHSAPALADSTRALLERITSGAEAPIATGLGQLDEQLDGGFWPGLHMLVGGTGGGKTQLAMQSALHAATEGIPVVYALFEMSSQVGMLRVIGELADVAWGKLMRGRASPAELERIEQAYARIPPALHFEAATPYAWPASRISELCAELRRIRPEGPALFIIDYAQLAGDMADDARQRVMRVAYAAQIEANRHRISALLVSSTARPGYGALADIVKVGGLGDAPGPFGGRRRIIGQPHALIGLGKEAGELEYSAESVTVLGSGGESEDTGRILIAATVKRRTGPPSWCALQAIEGRVREATHIQRVGDLPAAGKSESALDDRVLEAIDGGSFSSAEALRGAIGGRKQDILESLERLETDGRIEPRRQRQPFRRSNAREPLDCQGGEQ